MVPVARGEVNADSARRLRAEGVAPRIIASPHWVVARLSLDLRDESCEPIDVRDVPNVLVVEVHRCRVGLVTEDV